jgi:hypothetical protein
LGRSFSLTAAKTLVPLPLKHHTTVCAAALIQRLTIRPNTKQ